MREEIQKRFQEDLSASQVAEIASLEEENLLKNLERQRTLFDSVVAQLKQAQLTSSFQGVTAQVIQPPAVMPGRLNAVFIFALALVAGCTLGGGAAFMAELMDPRIRSMVEMRTMLDMPIFAVIPQLSPDQVRRSGGIEILSHRSPQSFLAESYKSARTSLECLRRNRRAHVLLVSSPNPGDGKTTTASNLAISLAHAGRRVLLVDGDLRKPSLHAVYNLGLDHGLTQVLGDRAPAQEVIQSTAVENLDLIAAGRAVPNPAELLASRRLGELFDEVRPLYEVVIVDSSPLLAVTDPSIISASADALLLVSRIGGSRRQDFERARELIETLEIPVVGAIINGVTREQGGYGYGYPYGGTYSPAFTAEGLDRRIPPTGI
jgi:capsular exopolysaccharide synthesis family protein